MGLVKSRNLVIYNEESSVLNRLQEEYEMLGRYCTRQEGALIVHALPKNALSRKQKRRQQQAKRKR